MGFTDFVGGLGFPTSFGDMGTDLMNPIGATMTDPLAGITTKMGYINPNSTPEGQMLRNQMGQTVDWGSTAAQANQLLGGNYVAPQAQAAIMRQAPVTQMQAAQGQALQGRAATAQGVGLDLSQANQVRAGQNALIGSLQGTAAGQGPSVAQEQLRQATAANIAGQASAAQSAHGAGRLAALRNAQNNQAQIQQTANSQAAGLRAQEIAAAQGNLGGALGLTRSQDIGAATTGAQLGQQNAQFNAGNQQAMNLANLGFGNQFSLQNMLNQQQANQFNAGAGNTSSLNFAQQQNAGNLQTSLANLLSQQNTQNLNFQQANALIAAQQAAARGQSGLATTAYQGTADYNAAKQKATTEAASGIMNNAGGAMSALSMIGL